MEKNTVLAVILSTLFLILWWTFFSPQPPKKGMLQEPLQENAQPAPQQQSIQTPAQTAAVATNSPEKEIVIETAAYKAVFTTRGAAVKHWYIKEPNGTVVDLVLSPDHPQLSTFPDLHYSLKEQSETRLVFSTNFGSGYTLKKTFQLSGDYLHAITIETNAPFTLDLGPGIGSDEKDKAESIKTTHAIGYATGQDKASKKLSPGEYPAASYRWVAMDSRYFLLAVLPADPNALQTVTIAKAGKKEPPKITFAGNTVNTKELRSFTFQFYVGPKAHGVLARYNLSLEKAIDFGWVGSLSKLALFVLNFFYGITRNYGWSIMIMTLCLQIVVFPLTIKSFKAQAAMKKLQPLIKDIQQKFKNDPKRLNIEMLNVYKTQKVNPLGGCLPMLLQLPIFWALFSALRNTYELRGAPWIGWIKDLSLHDPFYILPILMGIGMLFQQKMVSVSADPAQARMMYLMPVIFTFMFLKFPSGLVLYWLTNSIISMIEQYFIMNKSEEAPV